MIRLHWIIITLSILYISINAESDKISDLLPQSIVELKQYYDFISNLEKRGVINRETANREKDLYIQHTSNLFGKKELFINMVTTNNQQQSMTSVSIIIQMLAGIIVSIALSVFINFYKLPLHNVSPIPFEILFYIISIYLMMLSSSSALMLLGCFIFLVLIPTTISLRFTKLKDDYYSINRIYLVVWTIAAIYQQSELIGYLAIIAFQIFLNMHEFIKKWLVNIRLSYAERLVPSATIASFILLFIGTILHVGQRPNFLVVPFAKPLLVLGTFIYFTGISILSSKWYIDRRTRKHVFWLLQCIAFFSTLAAMSYGPMLELPFVQAIGGIIFSIWLLQWYIAIMPWSTPAHVIGSLLGLGVIYYVLAYFLK